MKFAATRPARRRLAAGALALTALLGATGCSAVSPIATGIQYDASDGFTGGPRGFIGFRNAIFVGAGENGNMRLIGYIINYDGKDHDYQLSVPGGQTDIQVGAGRQVHLEEPGNELIVDHEGIQPGELVPLTITADGRTETVQIPYLDGTLAEYRPYLPESTDVTAEQFTDHLYQETGQYGGEQEQDAHEG